MMNREESTMMNREESTMSSNGTKFMRVGEPGSERPVVEIEGTTFALDAITLDINGAFLASGGIDRTRKAWSAGQLPLVDIAGLRVGAPIAFPSAVICIGQNYAAHARESGDSPPKEPIVFFKHPNTIVGPYDQVRIPPGATAVDWEVELGVVVGARARYLESPEKAMGVIAGYVVSNDVSERDFQVRRSGGQWSKGKSCETFNPLGPFLRPADEVHPQRLRLSSTVGGAQRQDSSTADMIFSVAEIVHHLSQFMVLQPGDLINTGTPEGVALSGRFPYLEAGDEMELAIDGLGVQRQMLVHGGAHVQ